MDIFYLNLCVLFNWINLNNTQYLTKSDQGCLLYIIMTNLLWVCYITTLKIWQRKILHYTLIETVDDGLIFIEELTKTKYNICLNFYFRRIYLHSIYFNSVQTKSLDTPFHSKSFLYFHYYENCSFSLHMCALSCLKSGISCLVNGVGTISVVQKSGG